MGAVRRSAALTADITMAVCQVRVGERLGNRVAMPPTAPQRWHLRQMLRAVGGKKGTNAENSILDTRKPLLVW
eukprot:scaffold114661_cov60-Phaeocystis_antarctica.AAC.3